MRVQEYQTKTVFQNFFPLYLKSTTKARLYLSLAVPFCFLAGVFILPQSDVQTEHQTHTNQNLQLSEQRKSIYPKYEGYRSKSSKMYGKREQSNCNQLFTYQQIFTECLIFPGNFLCTRELTFIELTLT